MKYRVTFSNWQVQKEMAHNKSAADLPREQWHTWDPMLLSGLCHFIRTHKRIQKQNRPHWVHPNFNVVWDTAIRSKLTGKVVFFLYHLTCSMVVFFFRFNTHRGLIQCCKHIQFIETSLYIFGESAFGTITSIAITNGNGYHQILFPLRAGAICVQ